MLKINLSDKQKIQKKEKEQGPSPAAPAKPSAAASGPEASPPAKETARKKTSPALVAVLILVLIGAAVYVNRGFIMSLFPAKPAPVQETQKPAPAPADTVSAPVEQAPAPSVEPDPTFAVLNIISGVLPPRVWLSAVVLRYDGSYELQGMSFSHGAIGMLDSTLAGIGSITARDYPKKSASAETVYRFTVSGTTAGFDSTLMLDLIPTGDLIAFAAPVIEQCAGMGVKFTQTPQAGKTYGEKDLPFVLNGSFAGLKQVIGALCGKDPSVRIHQLVIVPDAVGLPFDKVKASFSLRKKSAL